VALPKSPFRVRVKIIFELNLFAEKNRHRYHRKNIWVIKFGRFLQKPFKRSSTNCFRSTIRCACIPCYIKKRFLNLLASRMPVNCQRLSGVEKNCGKWSDMAGVARAPAQRHLVNHRLTIVLPSASSFVSMPDKGCNTKSIPRLHNNWWHFSGGRPYRLRF